MQLKDIKSAEIVPKFAKDLTWSQEAFDKIIKWVNGRAKSLDAPLTMASIQTLTDAELQEVYAQYGLKYYADLSRETRETFLYEACMLYHFLGTPKAVELLCQYIFDTPRVTVTVYDNLAFDKQGVLKDETLLDVYDLEVTPFIQDLPEDGADRILENITHFIRNSQYLRNLFFTLAPTEVPCEMRCLVPDFLYVLTIENENICEV